MKKTIHILRDHTRKVCVFIFFAGGISTASAQCNAPSGLTITSISSSSISFNWGAVSGVSGYEYAVTDTSLDPASGTFTLNTNATVNFNFNEDFARYVHVRSKCGGIYSAWVFLCKANISSLGGSGRYCIGQRLNIGIPATTAKQQYTWYRDGLPIQDRANGSPADGDGSNKSYNPVMTASTAGNYKVVSTKAGCISTEFGNVIIALRSQVTGLTITYVSNDSVRFKWDNLPPIPGDFSGTYWQYMVTTDTLPPYSGTSTSDSTGAANNLTGGTEYYIYVIPECGSNGTAAWTGLGFSTDKTICNNNSSDAFDAVDRGAGYTYQWQVDVGAGFINITNGANYAGATTSHLALITPPSTSSGYRYRYISTNGISTYTSSPSTLRFGTQWTGNSNTLWTNTANWSCGVLPDANTDVTIRYGVARMPVVNANVSCRKVFIKPGTTFTVNPGFKLTITGK